MSASTFELWNELMCVKMNDDWYIKAMDLILSHLIFTKNKICFGIQMIVWLWFVWLPTMLLHELKGIKSGKKYLFPDKLDKIYLQQGRWDDCPSVFLCFFLLLKLLKHNISCQGASILRPVFSRHVKAYSLMSNRGSSQNF